MNINDIITESQHACPHCGGPLVEYSGLMEKKDACYYKVKASAKVWPSAYASGRLVQCRKKGASNYGNKSEGVAEGIVDTVKKGVNRLTGYKVKVSPGNTVWIDGTTIGYYTGSNSTEREKEALEKLRYELQKQGITTTGIKYADPQEFAGAGKFIPDWYIKVGNGQAETVFGMLKNNKIPGYAAASSSLSDPSGNPPQERSQSKWQDNPNYESIEHGVAEDTDNKCPPATQDIELNLKNRQKAINEYGYGPLNPDMPNAKFWMKKVDEWNLDSAEEAKQSLCGNCAAFDVRESTLDCIAQGIDSESPEDAAGVIGAGNLGYCKFLKFKCASRRTCDAWVTGGPLTDEQGVAEETDPEIEEMYEAMEQLAEEMAATKGVSVDLVWESFEALDDHMLYETAAWRRKEGKSKKGGLNAKGVASYRRENPGSKLQMAVTTKPSKLKKGSKAAKRRKSFCARMGGVKGPMKKPNGKPTRKALALRKWNC